MLNEEASYASYIIHTLLVLILFIQVPTVNFRSIVKDYYVSEIINIKEYYSF